MSAYLSDGWRSHADHQRGVKSRNDARLSNQDDKHTKAFVGVILLVVLGFVLAELHPASHTDSQNIQTTMQRIARPAN